MNENHRPLNKTPAPTNEREPVEPGPRARKHLKRRAARQDRHATRQELRALEG